MNILQKWKLRKISDNCSPAGDSYERKLNAFQDGSADREQPGQKDRIYPLPTIEGLKVNLDT